jgi:hypothetical protein
MTSRRLTRGALLLLLVTAALAAAEPWDKKPYTDWTMREAEQILFNSPWARPVMLPNLASDITPTGSSGADLIVRWDSALTLRQALARRSMLQGNWNQEQAERFLAAERPVLFISVFGRAFQRKQGPEVIEDVVRESAYLQLSESKRKVKPASIRFVREGEALSAIEFQFPREAEGQPVISEKDKKARFHCRLDGSVVSTEFDLRKMVRDGKPDF